MRKGFLVFFFIISLWPGVVVSQNDTTCKTSSTDYISCEQKAEAITIKTAANIAIRRAETLTIKLLSGKSLLFKNVAFDSVQPNYDSVKTYVFRKYFKSNNTAVVEKMTSNGISMLVINLANGKTAETTWLPIFSPDNRRFAVISGTEYNTYSPEKIEIYILRQGGYEKEFEYKPDGALTYLGSGKWQGNDRLAVKKTNFAKTNTQGKPLKSDISLVIIDNKWTVTAK